jgi:hypothetical protein
MAVIENYFRDNYSLTLKITPKVKNVDSNIHRSKMNVTGKVDTKYGRNLLMISPK